MGQGGDVVGVLDVGGHLHRLFRRATPGPIGHADKRRLQRLDLVHHLVDAAEGQLFLGREDLTGKGDLVPVQQLFDLHSSQLPLAKTFA